MHRTLVINVVGLTRALMGEHTPALSRLAAAGCVRELGDILPAVTCAAQATMLTGSPPREHGIVGNGWYHRDLSEVMFWRQSAALYQGERVWEAGKKRDAAFSCAKLFWWYNMYDSVDWAVTPRPMYPADGRKIPDHWANSPALHDELNAKLGQFPLFSFWGPNANIESSRWITDCALHIEQTRRPTLNLAYLPHLDYCLQKFGPGAPEIAVELERVDELCAELIEHAKREGLRVLVLSEYGVSAVRGSIALNQEFRRVGWLAIREELGLELLDAGMSDVFSVADHQIAHIYVRNPERVEEVAEFVRQIAGIDCVLGAQAKQERGLDHARSGELIAVASPDKWFNYYYWLDDDRAPDFARCVDIHRKPGYDPVELFMDPAIRFPRAKVASRVVKKMLGFRMLMDVIPLTPSLVRGSHGRPVGDPGAGPLLLSSEPDSLPSAPQQSDVKRIMLEHVFDERPGNVTAAGLDSDSQ
ncbi:MAG: alkaline phosphatase family protein [Polyangiaceae bacterium]|nr:alkaline phosphatase family protein [Polyangiaceae bacterium]